jgi:branched-chain amino acid transport system substrate-binding protein
MTKLTRRTLLLASAATAGSAMLIGTGKRVFAQGSKPIQIGVIQTLLGPAAGIGKEAVLGAQIAADFINANGGVDGRQIELVIRDDKGTPNDALATLRELAGNGIKIILGSSTSAPTFAVIPVLKELDVVWTMPGGTSLSFTHEMFTPNYFHSTSNAYMYYYGGGRMLADRHPTITKWSAIVADLAATQQLHRLFQRGLREGFANAGKQVELLEPVTSKFGAPDYRNQIAALQNSPAEGLLLAIIGGDALTFLQQARGFGLQDKIKVYMDATNGLDFGRGLKQNVPSNSYSATSWSPTAFDNAASRAFDQEAKRRTNSQVTGSVAAQGHNGITSYAEAIKAAKSADTNAVIQAMETITFQNSVYGPYKYRREDHQAQIDVGFAKFAPLPADPGWQVTEFIRLPWEQMMEPASPGAKFEDN